MMPDLGIVRDRRGVCVPVTTGAGVLRPGVSVSPSFEVDGDLRCAQHRAFGVSVRRGS
jgi:hypothetical protein